jgi:hypothetical protein
MSEANCKKSQVQPVGVCHKAWDCFIRPSKLTTCLFAYLLWSSLRSSLHFTSRSFQDVVGSYFPCNVVALRTLKAEVGCGMKKDLMEAAAVADSNWQVNGNWGVVQFGSPEK